MKFDSNYLWTPRYAKWIIASLFIIIGVLILAEIISVFTFRYRINAVIPVVPVPVVSNKPLLLENFDTKLFGTYIPPNMATADIKESKLNFDLVSIMYSEVPQFSSVIIRTDNGDEFNYKIGDTLSRRVIIKNIMADGVVVEHNGALESIKLPTDELKFEPLPEKF